MSGTRRVLVTGASGFIGRWSVPALAALDYEVHAVVSAAHHGELPEQLSNCALHRVDLLDAAAADALIETVMPTHLLHFAWIAQPGVYWQSADNPRWLEASQHLMRRFHAAGGMRAVMSGSCAEYGDCAGVCDEYASPLADDSAAGITAYAACKLKLQRALQAFSAQSGLSSAWGRIFFQYGPFEHPQRLVPAVIGSLLNQREALCSHGRQVRSFLHVADVGSAFAALLHADAQGPVNVGSDQPITLAELIEQIARQIGRPDLVRLGARPAASEPPVLIPVTRRLREETAWQPRFSLDAGLSQVIAWWRGRLTRQTP